MTRTALVTGAARGIGAAIADRFEGLGWTVYRMDRTGDESPGMIIGDVTSEDDWDRISRQIEAEVGHLDVLVNNAGILRKRRLPTLPLNSGMT